jgi:hypothetical protein
MHRWEIINTLIKRFGYQKYLEIGVAGGECFEKVEAEIKHGVDPDMSSAATIHMTSNEWFATLRPGYLYDIVFIDGLHLAKQVTIDILNSVERLKPGGMIVLHDCNPPTYEHQIAEVPPDNRAWNGNVWKAFIASEYKRECVDTDWGVGIINPMEKGTPHSNISWEEFDERRKTLLNLITPNEFMTRYGE